MSVKTIQLLDPLLPLLVTVLFKAILNPTIPMAEEVISLLWRSVNRVQEGMSCIE